MDASAQVAFSIQSARAVVRRSSGFTYLLSLLLPAGDRPFFWSWYAYLRWVDDIADNVTLSSEARCGFLTRQIQLVQDLYSGKRLNLSKDEVPLSVLVDYDIPRGALLKEPLSRMLGAIGFDIQRQGKLSGHTELRRTFDHEVANYLFTIGYFCRIPEIPAKVPGRAAANGAKIAHILRDILCDCDEGTFNISREEIDAYGLTRSALRADMAKSAGRRWVAANVRLAERQLKDGFREASKVAGLRYPVIVAILVAKYQAYLDRFRADEYLLQPQTRLGYFFVKNLLANFGALVLRRPRPIGRSIDRGLPDRLIASPIPAQARLLFRLLPLFNRPVVRALDEATTNVELPPASLRKLRRRFVTAYWLGRTSCAAIDPVEGKQDEERIHCAGLVYAFWSLAVLELDGLIDDCALPSDAAQVLVAEWLREAAEALGSGDCAARAPLPTPAPESSEAQDRLFLQLTSAFKTSLSRYRHLATRAVPGDSIPDTFLAEARSFLLAQIDSRDQKTVDPHHDWNWYLTQVINQKTLGFALAPMALWVRDGKCLERRQKLNQTFLSLNGGYWHWQILDDLADVEADTRQGLVTTPGYVLVSQGALARTYLERAPAQEMTCSGKPALVETALGSGLACERFWASPLSDGFRYLINRSRAEDTPATCDGLMRCALTNSDDDAFVDLRQLSLARRDQAASYTAAMKAGDPDAALDALAQSRVGIRILAGVDEDVVRIEARDRMASIPDTASRTMLGIIELLIRHCYRKAQRANSRMAGRAACL